jgi:hypothetical protein
MAKWGKQTKENHVPQVPLEYEIRAFIAIWLLFTAATTCTPRCCLYFDVVVGLAGSNDPESYAGGSIATGRVTQAGQVEGNDPD